MRARHAPKRDSNLLAIGQSAAVLPGIGLVRERTVLSLVEVSRSTLLRYVERGLISPPVKIGPRAKAWPVAAVRSLIERLERGDAWAASTDAPPAAEETLPVVVEDPSNATRVTRP